MSAWFAVVALGMTLSALVTLIGCSGFESRARVIPSACSLITGADVQEVLGGPTRPQGETSGVDGVTTCQYAANDGSHSVLVRVSPKLGREEHQAFPFDSVEEVTGLGDDARFAWHAVQAGETAGFDPGSALSVLKGTVEISIF
jgi:hypothetical protein